MKSIKEIKAAILAEIEAEKKLEAPELVEEPFALAEAAFVELAEFDVTKESIGTTVGAVRSFLNQLFDVLTKKSLETLRKAEEENRETEKKKAEWEALPEFMRKEEEFVFQNPLEIMEKEFLRSFEKAEEEVTEKLTQFLDDRVHADRNSLVREKKKAQKQLYVARETSEVFRRSYDQAARYRQEEEVRVLDERWEKKFTSETTELKDRIEHLEFQRRLQAQTIKTKDAQLEEAAGKIEEQNLSLKDMKVKLDVAKKGAKRGGGHGHGHGHSSIPSHAAGAGGGAGVSHSVPWNPNHAAASSLSPLSSSTTTRVAEGKEGNIPDARNAAAAAEKARGGSEAPKEGNEAGNAQEAADGVGEGKTVDTGTQTGADDKGEAKQGAVEAAPTDPVVSMVSASLAEAKEMVVAAAAKEEEDKGVSKDESEEEAAGAAGDKKEEKEALGTAAVDADDPARGTINDSGDSGDMGPPQEAKPTRGDPSTPTASPGSGGLALKKQLSSNSFLSSASEQERGCQECEELRGEIKMLRARLVDIVETTRSESPVPLSGRSNSYYSRTRTSSGSPGDGVLETDRDRDRDRDRDSPGLPNSFTRGYSDGVSPLHVTANGSAVFPVLSRDDQDESLDLSRANSSGPSAHDPSADALAGETPPQRSGSAVQEGIGSVSVSQSGRGVILSSTRGGIEGEQGSLDLMSGYGLSQERSQVPGGDGAVAGRPHTLDTRSVVSADGSRYSTNETLLADMRVGMAGDNILQSYGSSNDIGGDVESNMRLQLESLQEQMVQTMKREKEVSEQLVSRDLQVASLGGEIREAEKRREEQERLHSLQMLERGILLKELSQQVNDMRSQMRNMEVAQRKASKQHARELARVLSEGAPGTTSRPSSVGRRTPVQVPMSSVQVEKGLAAEHEHRPIAAVSSGGASVVVVDPTKSTSRMLAASSSMPLLSDEYGNFATTGKDVPPNPGRLSPVYKLRGKSGEKTEFTMNDLDRDTRKIALQETANYMEPERMDQLRSVRSHIVGMLSERYPPEKRKAQMLAVDKARERGQKDREARLADKVVKKTIRL
jgi:hypothetical protein